jgi:hypothetical protein
MSSSRGGGRFALRKCAAASCCMRIQRRHLFCSDDWNLVPRGLQTRLVEQLQYGIAWKCHPTEGYVKARDAAIAHVNTERERRFARPELPLFQEPKAT